MGQLDLNTRELIETIVARCKTDTSYKNFSNTEMINFSINLLHYFIMKPSKSKLDDIINAPLIYQTLPKITYTLDSCEFNIFGIFHGTELGSHYLINMSEYVRGQISSLLGGYLDSSNHKELFCEEGLSTLLYLDQDREIIDISHFLGLNSLRVMRADRMSISLDEKLKNLAEDIVDLAIINLLKNNNLEYKIKYIGLKSLKDISYQQKYGELIKLRQFGQPIDLELDYVKWLTSESDKYDVVSSSERSLYTARTLLEKQKILELQQVNYIGGLGHLSAIAYFLQNPDYSFGNLKSYVKNLTHSLLLVQE